MIEFVKYLPKHVLSALKGLQQPYGYDDFQCFSSQCNTASDGTVFCNCGNVENFTQHVEAI